MIDADAVILSVFVGAVLAGAWLMARRDALFAGFAVFFLIYTIFAMIGYRYLPILSEFMNAYFGLELFRRYVIFVVASFGMFMVAFWFLEPRLVGGEEFTVAYRPDIRAKWLGFATVALLAGWMGATLPFLYASIDYSGNPQIPSAAFSFAFKNLIFVLVLVLAFARRHASTGFELAAAWMLLGVLCLIFLLTALKSGNRTDIFALLLGVAWLELAPHVLDHRWRLRRRFSARLRRRLLAVGVTALIAMLLIESVRQNRGAGEASLPVYARVMFNDYYAPAHILFAAMAFDFVRPLFLLKSSVANALLVGGMLNIPYPQTELGNILLPGTSTRSTGFAFYIFTEGFMAGGSILGALYNGIVPVVLIALWRRLGRTRDLRYNAVVGALCAMSFATIARSGNYLFIREYLFALLPYLWAFRFMTGARLSPVTSDAHDPRHLALQP